MPICVTQVSEIGSLRYHNSMDIYLVSFPSKTVLTCWFYKSCLVGRPTKKVLKFNHKGSKFSEQSQQRLASHRRGNADSTESVKFRLVVAAQAVTTSTTFIPLGAEPEPFGKKTLNLSRTVLTPF